jgi:chromosome segregation ATPase
MTNLTTAWQTFIQSLTSSKFIITVINLATKLLDGFTKVMSIGGDFTKSFVAGVVSVVAITRTLHKVNDIRKAIGNSIKESAQDEAEASKEISEAKKKTLEYEKAMLQLRLKGTTSALDNAYKAEDKLNSEESMDDSAYTEVYTRQNELLKEQQLLKEQIRTIDSTLNQDTTNAVQLQYDLHQKMQMMLQESQAAELAKLDAQLAANEALQQELSIEEQRILYEQQITQEKIKQLEAQLAMLDANDPSTLGQRVELETQISNLKDTEGRQAKNLLKIDKQKNKLVKAGNKLEQKRGKIVQGEVKNSKKILTYGKQFANKILKAMGVNTNKISKG